MKVKRDYSRLLNIRGTGYLRNNAGDLLKRSLESKDLKFREFYMISTDHPDDYSEKLVTERFKEFKIMDPMADEDNDSFYTDSCISDLQISILEKIIMEYRYDIPFLKVIIFYLLVENIYHRLEDEDLLEIINPIKEEVLAKMKEFQSNKPQWKRVTKIETSSQKFLMWMLSETQYKVKKYVKEYKILISRII